MGAADRRLPPPRPNLAPANVADDTLAPKFEQLSAITEYEDTPLPNKLPGGAAVSSSRNPRIPVLPTEDEEMFKGLDVDESIVADSRALLRAVGMHPEDPAAERFDLAGRRALCIATNHGELTPGTRTGVFCSELSVPYYAFLDAGMEVEVASPAGGLGSGRWRQEGGPIDAASVWTSVIEFNLFLRRPDTSSPSPSVAPPSTPPPSPSSPRWD